MYNVLLVRANLDLHGKQHVNAITVQPREKHLEFLSLNVA